MVKKLIIFLVLAVAAFGASFFFKDALISGYNNVGQSVANFKKSDLGNTLTEVAKQMLTPGPLNIGGKENSVILTKAQIIAQTNLQRRENGDLPALKENAKLNAAALAKANDMFAKQYFEHISPGGVDPGTLVKKSGYEYIVSGENLILGNFADEKEVVQKWMDSPGHRANILNERFSEIGVAMVKGTYEGHTVWIGIQEFGLPLSACNSPSGALKASIDADKNRLDALGAQIDAKKQELENTNKNSPGYNALVNEYNAMAQDYNAQAEELKNSIANYNNQINAFNACVKG